MNRDKMADLLTWKDSSSRKPLLIRGARQVGKTWLMKEFGKNNYARTAYLNFEKNRRLGNLFNGDFDIRRILVAMQAETGIMITEGDTLIIFDEIQEVPEALTALKYFYEEAPGYHIIAAGSLLGVAIHSGISFPVGKVEFLDLYPLTFSEFLIALGDRSLAEILAGSDWKLITGFKHKYIDRLRQYYFTGGMPEVVQRFSDTFDFSIVRELQRNILNAYEFDFSKYASPDVVPRIRMVWNSLSAQLAKENRKFIYGALKEGSRARDYEAAISWLTDSGLAHRVTRASKPALPLKAYEERSAFKLFISDIGLLCAMNSIEPSVLLEGNKLFTEFKGALTEQYVFQQINNSGSYTVYYWTAERSTAEVDFLVQYGDSVFPLEVKAEENLQAKSLKVFREKFKPALSVRTSMSDYRREEWLLNLPLYAINQLGSESRKLRET